jgi:hypothetical protein
LRAEANDIRVFSQPWSWYIHKSAPLPAAGGRDKILRRKSDAPYDSNRERFFLTTEEKMKAKPKSLMLAALVAAGLFGMSTTAQAQSYKHIHSLVSKLEKQLNVLHKEVDAHFKPFPQYTHLHHDVVKMEKLAKHIHQLVDQKANIHHVLADVKALDKTYHHVRGLFKQMAHYGQLDPQTVFHVTKALNAVGSTIHHLRDDLEEIEHGHHHP